MLGLLIEAYFVVVSIPRCHQEKSHERHAEHKHRNEPRVDGTAALPPTSESDQRLLSIDVDRGPLYLFSGHVCR